MIFLLARSVEYICGSLFLGSVLVYVVVVLWGPQNLSCVMLVSILIFFSFLLIVFRKLFTLFFYKSKFFLDILVSAYNPSCWGGWGRRIISLKASVCNLGGPEQHTRTCLKISNVSGMCLCGSAPLDLIHTAFLFIYLFFNLSHINK